MHLHVVFLSLLLGIFSCGKKPEANNQTKTFAPPSSAQLYFNALKEMRRAILSNDIKAFKKVILGNPEIDLNHHLSDTGETLLIIAIKKDFRDIRNFLLEKGVQLERANVNRETPLIAATNYARANSVKVLINNKVDLEKRDTNGDTALHIALKKSLDEIAIDLIKAGADTISMDGLEKDALSLAEKNDTPGAFDLIRKLRDSEYGTTSITTLRKILLEGDHKRLQYIVNKYPKIASDEAFQSINPLALLIDAPNEKSALLSAELLLRFDANVNGPEGAEVTPLIMATAKNKMEFANLYLSSDANPQLLDKNGKSALIHAVEKNNFELVRLLISYSASEKYTFRKNGKKLTLSACNIAKKIQRNLRTVEEKQANDNIKRVLNCYMIRRSTL